ncbi:MAG: type II secretion system secretin GspD [Caldimonas sp.]
MAAALTLSSLPLPAQTPASRTAAGAPQPRFRGAPVTLNFVNADIEGVSRAMAAILRQQFIVDPRVRGTITLYSEEPLTPNQAYLNFLAALRGLGFTVVETGGIFKVVPEADAKLQAGTVSVDSVSRRGDQVITQIFRLSHENANNLVPVLRPLITPNNTINANPGNNTLVITDYAENLQRLAQIIATMDTPAAGDIEVIPLRYAVASDIQPLLQRLSDGGGPVAGVPGAQNLGTAAPSILVDSRSNSLIVRSANPSKMASVRSLIAKLDLPPQGSATTGNVWVVHLRNADATKLAQVLRAAFSSGGGGGSSGGSTSPLAPNPAGAAGTANAVAAAAVPISASAGPSTGGFIQADPSTNSLVITAAEPLYRQVRSMIDKLDERRAQVYIESLIVEVSGDNTAEFGFQWQGVLGNKGSSNIVIGGTNFGSTGNLVTIDQSQVANGTPAISLGQGLNIGLVRNFFGTYGLAAIANFLQSQANTNIMSTPNLVTLDNEEAKIIVGSNVPFVTGQFTQTGGALTNPFQTIERKDVGITLRIKPQIGENGAIRMTIFQESSSLAAGTAPGTSNAGPTTNKRSIESTVVVDDGQILVLGGLIEDTYTDNKSKVPLLGDIPYVGALFRTETRSKKRTNLMVFLRPTVLRDAETSNKLSVDRYDLIRSFQQEQQPRPSLLVPVNEAPVAPPLPRLEDSIVPIAAPQSSPGTTKPGTPPPPDPSPVPPPASQVSPAAPPPASAPGG